MEDVMLMQIVQIQLEDLIVSVILDIQEMGLLAMVWIFLLFYNQIN